MSIVAVAAAEHVVFTRLRFEYEDEDTAAWKLQRLLAVVVSTLMVVVFWNVTFLIANVILYPR